MSKIINTTEPFTLSKARQIQDEGEPGALIKHVSDLIAKDNSNAVIDFEAPAHSPTSGSLAGIPFGIKDNIDCPPFATTGGSPALQNNVPVQAASSVARLQAAGAVPVAKLNMHELAFGVTNENPHFGSVLTPLAENRVAGGSSGGSAAAVALGLLPFVLGSDTGGSTRIPAAFCGIVGFRPTTGRYGSDGVINLSPTRDTIGPMANSVADISEIDSVLAADDQTDTIQRPLRVGLIYRDAGLSTAIDARFNECIALLEQAGIIETILIDEPDFDDLEQKMGQVIVAKESHDFLAQYAKDRLGTDYYSLANALGTPSVREIVSALPDRMPMVSDKYKAATAGGGIAALKAKHNEVFNRHNLDVLAMPTVAVAPPKTDEGAMLMTDLGERPTFPTLVRNASLASLVGGPSLSIPAGSTAEGLPMGFMIDGRVGGDRFLLAAGQKIEVLLNER